ncbi:serine/threonine-protein kinase crk1 [Sporormia fimetaria CBS 119925]|uniref:Serine/threonine-protein kinase crk1 n=1 Tax=Sporormia fimetaria CBS 119925 TaxID=1340428 RepID=A0A6A6VIG7_9PLEO|nr:serine/threonine-protein kinase crk1 [Sporormia fimetaria CBS 119925]
MASTQVALSPRPNPPGPGASKPLPLKSKTLNVDNAKPAASVAASRASTPGLETELDAGAQMNEQVRNRYVIDKKIGQGTYADVFSAHVRSDPSKLVAIKRIRLQQEWENGITMDSIREIRFLSELKHPNVILLHDVFSTKDQKISLVLEHLPLGDLEEVWLKKDKKDPMIAYTQADIKSWILMLSRAVWFCHSHRILHRDIKSNNCLIAANGCLKLADFGLARPFAEPGRKMTHQVITRYYRPPELLYMAQHYGPKVDVWSVGMILAELTLRQFMCPGNTEMEQLNMYCEIFGTPTEETWPGVSKLQCYVAPDKPAAQRGHPKSWWESNFGLIGEDGRNLLRGMLTMDPKKRLSSEEVVKHPWFSSSPRPTKMEDLPTKGKADLKRFGDDLKRHAGELDSGRGDKVARKLFG